MFYDFYEASPIDHPGLKPLLLMCSHQAGDELTGLVCNAMAKRKIISVTNGNKSTKK